MKKIFFYLFLATLVLYSCQKEAFEVSDVLTSIPSESQVTDRDIQISRSTAAKVAEIFKTKNSFETRSTGIQSPTAVEETEISEIKGEDGSTEMYVVNYNKNEGFVIIGATQNYYPILAYSDKSSFLINEDIPLALHDWLQGQKAIIVSQKKETKLEKVSEYHRMWNFYKGKDISKETQAKNNLKATSSEFENFVMRQRSEWDMQGVQYQQHYHDEPEYANYFQPDYHCVVFGLINTEMHQRKSIPLLKTKWDQGSPYNKFTPIISRSHTPTGCVTTAMVQVLKYYEYPQILNYRWANMKDSYTYDEIGANSDDVAGVMSFVGAILGTKYNPSGSSASMSNMHTYFKSLGYEKAEYRDYDIGILSNQIKLNRPVVLSGTNQTGVSGHAWVCDGFETNTFTTNEMIVVIWAYPNSEESPQISYSDSKILSYNVYQFGHMNWGWGGFNDGWYTASTSGVNPNANLYLTNRKMITNIYPSN